MSDGNLNFDDPDVPEEQDLASGDEDMCVNDPLFEPDNTFDGDVDDTPDDNEDDDDFRLDGYETLHLDVDHGNAEQDSEDDVDASSYVPSVHEDVHEQEQEEEEGEEDIQEPPLKHKRPSSVPSQPAKSRRAKRLTKTSDDADDGALLNLDDIDDIPGAKAPRNLGTFGRRERKKGDSLAAYHKRITHELDAGDGIMMEMRDKGFSDRQIADRLAKEGLARYDPKSISTRIMRIKLAQAENVDFLLKEGYKEWEFEDDQLLLQAFALADIEIRYEIERIRAWRFRKVSEYMRRLNSDAWFSANACRERYSQLISGTARIPTDMDDDPDARRQEMEDFREKRERERNIEAATKEAKERSERKRRQEQRDYNAQKAEETATRRAQKEAEIYQRSMDRAAQAQIRAQKAEQNLEAKKQRNESVKKQREIFHAKKDTPIVITVPQRKRKRGAIDTAEAHNSALALTQPADISGATPDPRCFLSVSDLRKMGADRGFEDVSEKDKDELLQELQDADDEFSLPDLRKMCERKKLDVKPVKAQMKYAIAMEAAKAYASFASGVTAAMASGALEKAG